MCVKKGEREEGGNERLALVFTTCKHHFPTAAPKMELNEQMREGRTTYVLQKLQSSTGSNGDNEVVASDTLGELPQDLGHHVGLDGQDDHLGML